jgi:putative cell wall-binding protein
MYFSARDITRNTKLQSDMKELYFSNIAIRNLRGNERYDTAVEVSNEGWKNGSESVVLTNGNSVVDGVTATPLATSKDAPILLTEKGKIPEATKAELKRLNPKNIVVIGGTSVVDENALKELNTILPSSQVKRIGGIDRYETSLLIAKEIVSPINKVYVTGGYGEADSLSIASKAGEEKQPIILSEKESINNDTFNWLKTKNLQDAYFIGGSQVLSDKVIEKINSLTSNNVSNNRIFGEDRQETNAKVIEKFYTDSKYSSVLVTKSNPLVDALSAGPLAAKLKSPIVILGNEVSPLQNNVLYNKNTNLVYQVGGGINQTAFNKTLDLLK